jgi:hypothetical protein
VKLGGSHRTRVQILIQTCQQEETMKPTTLLKWGTVILITIVLIGGWTTTRDVSAQASTWHVATSGSDNTGDGSEAKPFATIQHGIDVASNGDTVLVHPGVYLENINFNGKNITVGSLFVTTGNEDYILQTVIDGNHNGHVVTFTNGEADTAQLSGFTITNGYVHGDDYYESSGGGVFCRNYSNPTLTHLQVKSNEAVQDGAGLYFEWSSPTIRDVSVTDNLAGRGGGGIRYSYGSVNLENVVVAHNSAGDGGSGIWFYHAEGTIKNALIADNSGDSKGGGLGFDGCSPTLTNVTVVGNSTTGNGGGLNVSFASQPTLVNSIVWGNTPEQIYFDWQWWGEAITIEYSDIEGGQAGIITNGHGPVYWGDRNLDTSPRFVNASLGNYRLANDSPAIGAGKVAGAPATDIEGNPRPNPATSNPDMGAYENPLGAPQPPDATPPETWIVLTPAAPDGVNGWYRSPVTVSPQASDASPVIDLRCALDPAVAPTAFDDLPQEICPFLGGAPVTSDGQHTFYAAAMDIWGNKSTPVSREFQIDASPPVLTCPAAGPFLLHSGEHTVGPAGVDASVSGLDEAASTLSGTVTTERVGPKTLTFTAVDLAGNSASQECSYKVIFDFGGFYPPVESAPTLNMVKAGQAAPLKFSLAGDQGLDVIAAGYPASRPVQCVTLEPAGPLVATQPPGNSGLRYAAGNGEYVYVWKTDKAWVSTCRLLLLRLVDGTEHKAYFQFK